MRRWFRSVLREPAVAGAPRRVWRDVALVGVAEVGAIVEAVLRTGLPRRWPTLVLALVVIASLLWRRTHPLPVMALCFGSMAALSAVDLVSDSGGSTGLYAMSVLLVSLYALARWASGRDVVIGIALAAATSSLAIISDWTGPSDAIGGVIVLAITCSVGLTIRFRDRARQRDMEQVRLVEREQLARDLHDTVAHHVSAIAIRAQAGLAVASTRPEAALEALTLISTEASRTLAEMRAMVGVLRRDGRADLAPTPSLDDVGRLAQHTPGAPQVDVTVDVPADDARGGVAPAVATAVYRIAQEAVTNAQRHARNATRIAVAVGAVGDRVHVRVVDDGEEVDTRRLGDGYGLRGMVERAELLGGACTARPAVPRGWVVDADLPRTGVAS